MAPTRDRKIPDLISAVEAAEILGVTRQAVQLMASGGTLAGLKVGSTWVFRRAVVAQLRDARAEVTRKDDPDQGHQSPHSTG